MIQCEAYDRFGDEIEAYTTQAECLASMPHMTINFVTRYFYYQKQDLQVLPERQFNLVLTFQSYRSANPEMTVNSLLNISV